MATTRTTSGLLVLIAAVALPIAFTLGRVSEHAAGRADQTFEVQQQSGYSSALQDTIAAGRRNAIVVASQRVAPAVVSVNVTVTTAAPPQSFFDLFFGGGGMAQRRSMGSGFIIRQDGLILTNEHVVHDAQEAVVTLADGRDYPADVVGTDPITDLALLKLRGASGLPVAPLGTSRNLIIGEWAIAIGNPFGFYLSNAEPSVTAGVISGVGRNIVPDRNEETGGMYVDMIQTDASINPGNSGGPLVNALGEVIGVNASILSTSGGSVGLGFAIPIDRAQRIVADLLATGKVRRAWVGAEVQVEENIQAGQSRHVRIARVAPGSPAAKAGLREGMMVARVAGRRVGNTLDWEARMIDARIGEPLDITIRDGTRERTVRVQPQDIPSLSAERVSALSDQFELVTVTPAVRSERRIASERGALIVRLSDAARSVGLREGDVIVGVNQAPVETAEQVARYMDQLARRRSAVRLIVERSGQMIGFSFYLS
jgi:serine protease Do